MQKKNKERFITDSLHVTRIRQLLPSWNLNELEKNVFLFYHRILQFIWSIHCFCRYTLSSPSMLIIFSVPDRNQYHSGSDSPKELKIGHFKLLLCKGLFQNVQTRMWSSIVSFIRPFIWQHCHCRCRHLQDWRWLQSHHNYRIKIFCSTSSPEML